MFPKNTKYNCWLVGGYYWKEQPNAVMQIKLQART